MNKIRQQEIRSEFLWRLNRPAVKAAEVSLHIKQLRVSQCCVVIQNHAQRKLARELVVHFCAQQVVVEYRMAGVESGGRRTLARAKPVVDGGFVHAKPCRGSHGKTQIHSIHIAEKGSQTDRREEVLACARRVAARKTEPLIRRGRELNCGAVPSKRNVGKKLVRFAT